MKRLTFVTILTALLVSALTMAAWGQTAEDWKNSGDRHYDNRDYNRAIADYNQAIRLNPNYAAAYYNRGTAYALLGDDDRAIADYSHAIRLNPDFWQLYYTRGWAYYLRAWKKGNYEKIGDMADVQRAEADLTRAYQLNPDDEVRMRLLHILGRWHPRAG